MHAQRILRRLVAVSAAAALALVVPVGSAVGEPNPASGPHPTSAAIVTADLGSGTYGAFAESMAALPDGRLLVSVTDWNTNMAGEGTANLGRLVAVDPVTGQTEPFGDIDVGKSGMQSGVTVAADGRVYVAAAFTGDGGDQAAVYQVPEHGPAVPVMTMPAYAFPNGLVVDGTDIYATDSLWGAVWKGSTTGLTTDAELWFMADELAPAPPHKRYPTIGANGIVVSAGGLLVTNWNTGSIYRIPIQSNGDHGALELVVTDPKLREADGITLDPAGRIWVAVNAGRGTLAVVDGGTVHVTRTQNGWLDYPTQPVLIDETMYVVSGSYFGGTPFVTAFGGLIG